MTHTPRKPALLLATLISLLAIGVQIVPQVSADRMDSNSFIIQFGNFNSTSGTKSSSSYNVTDTVGQTAAAAFGPGTNYFVGAGFQYIYQIGEFSFSISDLSIELGELQINTHSSDTNVLTVSSRGTGGYTVYAYELDQLQHTNGTDEIPDTVCDNGLCDETDAEVWTTQSVPGFGFNITGDDTAADFVDSTYFRQFADDNAGETMQAVMSNAGSVSNRQATVTYKVGIDANQAAGSYQTSIVYVAVPSY